MIRILETPFDPTAEITAFNRRTGASGAVVTFLGAVRAEAGDNKVTALELEHFPGVTEKSIADIVQEARERWPVSDIEIIHRVGRLAPGEPIVLVCVAADHRREAFEAADLLMDYLKTEAMFWKKEIRSDGEDWIEPRAADYEDAARWRKKNQNE